MQALPLLLGKGRRRSRVTVMAFFKVILHRAAGRRGGSEASWRARDVGKGQRPHARPTGRMHDQPSQPGLSVPLRPSFSPSLCPSLCPQTFAHHCTLHQRAGGPPSSLHPHPPTHTPSPHPHPPTRTHFAVKVTVSLSTAKLPLPLRASPSPYSHAAIVPGAAAGHSTPSKGCVAFLPGRVVALGLEGGGGAPAAGATGAWQARRRTTCGQARW